MGVAQKLIGLARYLTAQGWDHSAGGPLPGAREADSPVTGPATHKSGSASILTIERTNTSLHALVRAITTAGSIYFGSVNGLKWGIGGSEALNTANWFSVDATTATFAGAVTAAGVITGQQVLVEGASGVRGLKMGAASDNHSARLIWQSAASGWLAFVENTTGELRFYSGATYGSVAGTLVHRFYPNGDFRAAGELIAGGALTVGGSAGFGADLDGPAEWAIGNGLGENIFFSNASNETQLTVGGTARVIAGVGYLRTPPAYSTTTASAANVNVASDGTLARSTSAAKYKTGFETLTTDRLDAWRHVVGGTYRSLCPGDDPDRLHAGIIADQAHELGLSDLVIYGPDGAVEGFAYDRAVAYLAEDNRALRSDVAALTARLTALEAARTRPAPGAKGSTART